MYILQWNTTQLDLNAQRRPPPSVITEIDGRLKTCSYPIADSLMLYTSGSESSISTGTASKFTPPSVSKQPRPALLRSWSSSIARITTDTPTSSHFSSCTTEKSTPLRPLFRAMSMMEGNASSGGSAAADLLRQAMLSKRKRYVTVTFLWVPSIAPPGEVVRSASARARRSSNHPGVCDPGNSSLPLLMRKTVH